MGRSGRSLSHATKVQFNGNLMVGKAYIAQLGLEPSAASGAFRHAGWRATGPDAVA
jgi:hypothetical protein